MNQKVLNNAVVNNYKGIMMENLRYSFPLLYEDELSRAIDWAIDNRYVAKPGRLYNNYDKKTLTGDVIDILNYIEKLQPILCSSGVLFKSRKYSDNPFDKMLQKFLKQRSVYKTKMKEYPKNSYDFEKYNLLQLLEKINANGGYGLFGAPTCLFYNIFLADSVTFSARSSISSSIMLFEAFLANNVKFNSLNEVITFISNVCREKPERIFSDSIVIGKQIAAEQCFFKIMRTADPMLWIPTENELSLVWDIIRSLHPQDINRLYYKNNLYDVFDLPMISELTIAILQKLDHPYVDPNSPPEEIRDDLDLLTSIIKEFVYYRYPYIDKFDRIEYMPRDVVVLSDTDSTIISFDAWYRFMLEKVQGIDIPLARRKYDLYTLIHPNDDGKRPDRQLYELVPMETDYNFYTDEVIEVKKKRELYKLIPQESLRYAIINIMAYICSNLVLDYLKCYCDANHSNLEGDKCHLMMKNEFFFDSILITDKRKNYASIQTRQEDKIIAPGQKTQLDIKGLPIKKSTMPEKIKQEFQDILYEDILTAKQIDQRKVMKKLIMVEKDIIKSIMNKEILYYKPDNIAPISSYADPMRQNGITAAMVYNKLRIDDMPAINLNERNAIFKIKLNITKNNVHKIHDKYPDIHAKLVELLKDPQLSTRLGTIGFPMDSKVPDWVLEFVDINTIVNDNLRNFPLEAIGIYRLDKDSVNYSNVISL